MWRRDLAGVASRLARAASGAQCSTSWAAPASAATSQLCSGPWATPGLASPVAAHPPSVVGSQSRPWARALATAAPSGGLTVTDAAADRLRELQGEEGKRVYLRLTVEGGGCSGFHYEFSVEEEGPKPGDQVFEAGDAAVVADDVSMEFLRGATVDFESDLMRSAFVVSGPFCLILKVFNASHMFDSSFLTQVHDNPNADSSCGCGSSFAAK